MECKLFRDSIAAMGNVTDTQVEIPLETEIMVPDYLPAVFKIIKTLVHRVILQREVQNGHLLLEGYFRVEILYQGENQNLCTIEQKVAFSRQTELKGSENDTACSVLVGGEVQYIHCRALSQHRLDLRGAYNLCARIVFQSTQSLVTAVSGEGIQQKSCAIPAVGLYATQEKQFTLEEPIALTFEPEQVLHCYGFVQVQELRAVPGKAVAKGQANITVVYRCAQAETLQQQSFSLPFHQVIETAQLPEEGNAQVFASVIGCSVAAEEEDPAKSVLRCICLMTVQALRRPEYIGVADCFSTTHETLVSRRDIVTDALLETVSSNLEISIADHLPEDSLEVLECLCECFAPEIFPEAGGCILRGRVVAHLICQNALGEMDCYDKTADYQLPQKYAVPAGELVPVLSALCEGWHFSQNEKQVQIQVTVHLQGILCKKQCSNLVEEVSCETPLTRQEEVALRVYYARAGEEVFDIAKRYHANPGIISGLAGIDGEVLQQDCRLLIPQDC